MQWNEKRPTGGARRACSGGISFGRPRRMHARLHPLLPNIVLMTRARSSFRLLGIALAVALVGCLDDSPVAPRIETANIAPSLGVDLDASTRTASGLYYRDIAIGPGETATVGSDVSVRYSGAFINGVVFDSGGAERTPVDFTLGANEVLAGFDEGTRGMRVGGRRQLIIPPHLGYGSQPYGSIPGNSILVFTIELLSVS